MVSPDNAFDKNFWSGRRVFLTGHTGFKGGWLSLWLASMGAVTRGYSLDPATNKNFFNICGVKDVLDDIRGDIRDYSKLKESLSDFAPEIVFHLAAQPLVRLSYEDPLGTFQTNVIGTANVLQAIRDVPSVRAVVSVTTDKCYENKEWLWGYRETDPLGGYDPYSSSKACAEIVSAAFRQSYFQSSGSAGLHCGIATARAGNVIGGGDWSMDRLVPDMVRAFVAGEPVSIRRPNAIRPWQHVMEPIAGYLTIAQRLFTGDARFATAYNFGPSDDDARPVSWIVERLVQSWQGGASWRLDPDPGVHEAGYLKLDSSRARAELGWKPRMTLDVALNRVVSWYKAELEGEDMHRFTLEQIRQYEQLTPNY